MALHWQSLVLFNLCAALKVFNGLLKGERNIDILSEMGLHKSTVHTIRSKFCLIIIYN